MFYLTYLYHSVSPCDGFFFVRAGENFRHWRRDVCFREIEQFKQFCFNSVPAQNRAKVGHMFPPSTVPNFKFYSSLGNNFADPDPHWIPICIRSIIFKNFDPCPNCKIDSLDGFLYIFYSVYCIGTGTSYPRTQLIFSWPRPDFEFDPARCASKWYLRWFQSA